MAPIPLTPHWFRRLNLRLAKDLHLGASTSEAPFSHDGHRHVLRSMESKNLTRSSASDFRSIVLRFRWSPCLSQKSHVLISSLLAQCYPQSQAQRIMPLLCFHCS
ncbi:unnamed protein product [Aureobasidium pullulans]|nr:unnamed protein product [Aureobasidium pullulans]